MRLEQTDGMLRAAAERLFAAAREVAGADPVPSGGRYKVAVPGRDAVYLEVIRRGGSRRPPNTLFLHTGWAERLADYPGVTAGDNWYGDRRSAELVAEAERPEEVERAVGFLRLCLAGPA